MNRGEFYHMKESRCFMPRTIFGTTERSNFVLNMKQATVRKWINGILCACIIVPMIGAMFITGVEKANSFLASFLYATGFSCILFYIVLLLRKDISIRDYPVAFVIIAMAILSLASYYRVVLDGTMGQEAVNTAILGEMGRYEGLLSLLAYFGIFLLATGVMKRGSVQVVFDVFMGAGIFQAIVAVLQHIPGEFPSDFRKLPAILILKDVHLSSGLADSPIFYGSFLTLVSGVAIAGALYEKNLIRARIYGGAAVLFFLTGLFTSSVVPLIGIGSAIVIAVIIELANKKREAFPEGILKSPRKRLLVLIAVYAVIFALVFALQGIYLRDKAIAYSDSFHRLFIAGSPSLTNDASLWQIGAERSLHLISEHPLLGVGPDLMAKVQAWEGMIIDSLDKSYNEYLFVAATRGIPALLLYLVLLAATLWQAGKGVREFLDNREMWFRPALLTAILAYAVQAFFSASVVTVAPFFWLLMGFAWSKFLGDKAEP